MNTTQTSPANPVPALTPLAQSLLADWDDPDLSELDLARRHGLTLDRLHAQAAAPAFRAALALLRDLRESRRPLIIARAEALAAQRLTALTARDPTSATAAKEVRLAIKDLLHLLGAGGLQPPDRPKGDAPVPVMLTLAGPISRPATRPQAEPILQPTPTPHPRSALRADGGQDAPRSKSIPKRPRGTKPRPKPVSR
jgi:hypothetical protein